MCKLNIEFQPYPKTPRLFRDIVITEKLDGTNAAIQIIPLDLGHQAEDFDKMTTIIDDHAVVVQSRKRIITPGKTTDNYGFAAWVNENADSLVKALGPGTHYGEWWGSGINRAYGFADGERFFSLFAPDRYPQADEFYGAPGLSTVPVLYRGPFAEWVIDKALSDLAYDGSRAARGFMRPEGIIVYHEASRQTFKVLLENDALPKGLAEAVAA